MKSSLLLKKTSMWESLTSSWTFSKNSAVVRFSSDSIGGHISSAGGAFTACCAMKVDEARMCRSVRMAGTVSYSASTLEKSAEKQVWKLFPTSIIVGESSCAVKFSRLLSSFRKQEAKRKTTNKTK